MVQEGARVGFSVPALTHLVLVKCLAGGSILGLHPGWQAQEQDRPTALLKGLLLPKVVFRSTDTNKQTKKEALVFSLQFYHTPGKKLKFAIFSIFTVCAHNKE